MAVERVIKSLSDIVRNVLCLSIQRDVVEVEIPCVGIFFVKSHCAAVQFLESLMDSCKVSFLGIPRKLQNDHYQKENPKEICD